MGVFGVYSVFVEGIVLWVRRYRDAVLGWVGGRWCRFAYGFMFNGKM